MNTFVAVVLLALASVLVMTAVRMHARDEAFSAARRFFSHVECDEASFAGRGMQQGTTAVFTITCSAPQR